MINVLKGFFCIEGIDGSGKTTLVTAIHENRSLFQPAFQPTKGVYGSRIRAILQKKEESVDHQELLDLFIKDREENQIWIKDKIDQGYFVVLDRYILSSMAYQGLNENLDLIYDRNKMFYVPEMTFFLKITPSIALERRTRELELTQTPKEFFEHIPLQEKIYGNYERAITILEKKGYPITFLDADQEKEEILKNCLHHIDQIQTQ